MPGPTEPCERGLARMPAGVRRALLALGLVLVAGLAAAQVESEADARQAAVWDTTADRVETRISDPDVSTPELEVLRDTLVRQRAAAQEAAQRLQPAVDELQKRFDALGPVPAEGAAEAPEIAARRADLQKQIAGAQVPVLEAQEANQRANELIDKTDSLVRARFSAELMSRGPSPLRPDTWLKGVEEVASRLIATKADLVERMQDPVARRTAFRRAPLNVALVTAGLIVTFTLRRWLTEWVELRLAATKDRRSAAWALALRNLTRLLVPVVGVGLIFAALDPQGLFGPGEGTRHFRVPAFALVLIAAGWLSSSLLAPRNKPFRLLPLEDSEARAAARLVVGLGAVAAIAFLVDGVTRNWDLSTATQSAITFPLVLLGGLGLWRIAGLIWLATGRIAPGPPDHTPTGAPIRLRLLRFLARALQVVAVVAPLAAAAGYLPLAEFLVFRSMLTLGLIGTAIVVFDLVSRTLGLLSAGGQGKDGDDGLMPVAVATVIGLICVAPMAMIWGARPSDIEEVWNWLQQGVTFGGIRLSIGVIVTLVAVFALGTALTRLFQGVMHGTVLPRTRLDAGGRNAVLAGIAYVGFTISALAAVSAAGLDLSNIAIVAGALSVGIGFGLQNVVSNFVSGIILLVERPVKEGDWIEVGGFSGYVKGINVRSTEIQTFDRASDILPNSDLVAGTVLHRTHSGMSGRLQVPVSATYGADPKLVQSILLDIAEHHPLVLEEPSPVVLFLDLGPDTMNFELRCWLRDVNFSLSVRSDLNFEIVERFGKEGIRTQFYGRDLPPTAPVEPLAVSLQRAKKEE